jgi:predicted nucleic acid-binding Zn ribbon protein
MDKISTVRSRYDNPGKARARAVPMRWLEERVPAHGRYLDLFGGGLSAEMAVGLRPDVEVVSAEMDPDLHPALISQAAQCGYTPHLGDFQTVEGLFDLIYLDLTGNASEKSVQLVVSAKSKLRSDGALVVTISPDHEGDWAVQLNRPVTVAALLAQSTRMNVVGLMTYPNGDGKRMVLVVLHGVGHKLFTSARMAEMLERRGFWAGRHGGGMAWLFGNKSQRRRSEEAARQRDRERARRYFATSADRREKSRVRSRERYYANRDAILAAMRTPEYRQAKRDQEREARAAKRVMKKVRCGICRTAFLHYRNDVKFCSDECRRIRNREHQRQYHQRKKLAVSDA